MICKLVVRGLLSTVILSICGVDQKQEIMRAPFKKQVCNNLCVALSDYYCRAF